MAQGRRKSTSSGFTLIEFMIVAGIIGLLVAIALPVYRDVIERLQVRKAAADLMTISLEVTKRRDANDRLPNTLAGIPNLPLIDPWGRPYVYNYFESPGFNNGDTRKDHNLHPINSEFDLYSIGKDGESRPPLTARPSQDDVIYARDGSFVGLAKEF
jgi:general secretion pathway protein G